MSQARSIFSIFIRRSADFTKYPTEVFEFTEPGPITITVFDKVPSSLLARTHLSIKLGLTSMPREKYERLVELYNKHVISDEGLPIEVSQPESDVGKKYRALQQALQDPTLSTRSRHTAFLNFYFRHVKHTLTTADIDELADLFCSITDNTETAKRITLIMRSEPSPRAGACAIYSQPTPPTIKKPWRMIPVVAAEEKGEENTAPVPKKSPIEKLKEQLKRNKIADREIIINHIQQQTCNAVLTELHEKLLDPEFDYLREKTGCIKWSRWRTVDTVDKDKKTVSTSQSWADIEKAFQIKISSNAQSMSTEKLSEQYVNDLKNSHPYFAIKRKVDLCFWKKHNDTFSALLNGDIEELQKKSIMHFRGAKK